MKRLSWISLIIALIFVCGCNKKEEVIQTFGIKDYVVIDSKSEYVSNSFYTKQNGKKTDVIGFDGSVYFSYDSTNEYITNDSKFIYLFKDGLANKMYDGLGNLIAEGKINQVYNVEEDGSFYVYDSTLFNQEHEAVYTSKHLTVTQETSYSIYKNHLFSYDGNKNRVVNIQTKNEMECINYEIHGDYVILEFKGRFDLINLNNGQIVDSFERMEYGEYYSSSEDFNGHLNLILIKDNQKKYLVNNILSDKYELKLDNNHVLDFSACTLGAQLKDSNGNVLISDCLNDYQIKENVIIGQIGYSGESKLYIDYEDVSKLEHSYYFVNDILVAQNYENNEYICYDLEGNVISDYSLIEINQGFIGNKGNDYVFLDDELNEVSEIYKSIYCSINNYCVVKNEEGYEALFYETKAITPFEYLSISLDQDYIVLEDIAQKYVLLLEKGNNNFTFPSISKPYVDFDVDEIISEYDLDKKMIDQHLELFEKYAFIVENNTDLGKYKPYMYDIYEVICDHQKYINEAYFFNRLKTLSIEKNTSILNAGEYNWMSNEIDLNDESKSTIYHELMHFLDFSIHEDEYIQIWKYQGSVITNDEYLMLTQEEKDKCQYIYLSDLNADIVTEGGAELMSAKYYTLGISAYSEATTFLTGIEYIIGSEAFNEMFFGNNSSYSLMKLFIDSGFSYDDYVRIYDKFLNVALTLSRDFSSRIEAVEILIDLYKANVNSDWYMDTSFVYILKVLGGIGYNDLSNFKYGDILNGILFKDFIEYEQYEDELLKDINVEFNIIPIPVFIIENELYFGCKAYYYEEDRLVTGHAYFNYEFITGTVNNYHFIEE